MSAVTERCNTARPLRWPCVVGAKLTGRVRVEQGDACSPAGRRPPTGGDKSVSGTPETPRSHATNELEFHMSPDGGTCRPHANAGTWWMWSRIDRAVASPP